jgi:hypothetical protein
LALAQWFVVPGQGFREWLLTLHPFREFYPFAFLDEVPENFALRFRILVVIFIYIYIAVIKCQYRESPPHKER